MGKFPVIDTETNWADLRLLSGDRTYRETHNALLDAVDELEIMRLLGHGLQDDVSL